MLETMLGSDTTLSLLVPLSAKSKEKNNPALSLKRADANIYL